MTTRMPRVLLACGIVAALLDVGLDLFAAWRWAEYSYTDQAVSELSAIGAPTRSLWNAVSIPYVALFIAFAWGVWLAAGDRRALRVTALLLFGLVGVGVAWFFFPMHLRGAEKTYTDTGHVVVAGVQVVFALAAVGFAAAGLGRRFRLYSIVTLAALLLGGAGTGLYTPRVAAGLPTPWMGIVERVNVYGYMLWILVLAVVLLREQQRATGPAPIRRPRAPTATALRPSLPA